MVGGICLLAAGSRYCGFIPVSWYEPLISSVAVRKLKLELEAMQKREAEQIYKVDTLLEFTGGLSGLVCERQTAFAKTLHGGRVKFAPAEAAELFRIRECLEMISKSLKSLL